MKKLFRTIRRIVIAAIILMLVFTACGRSKPKQEVSPANPTPQKQETAQETPSKDETYYIGTWAADKVIIGDRELSVDDAIKLGAGEEIREVTFVFQESGMCGAMDKYGVWSMTDNGIKIGDLELEVRDGRILLPANKDVVVAFSKISDSQEFEPVPAEESEAEEGTESIESDGLRPEFKAAMDSYEAFYDDYCEFMKKYMENPTDFSLLTKYASMITELDEMQKKFDAWNSSDLSNAELKYYLEVNARIQQKMAGIL